jgi:hypothetical protein
VRLGVGHADHRGHGLAIVGVPMLSS